MPAYTTFGLRIAATAALPGLTPARDVGEPQLRVEVLGGAPPARGGDGSQEWSDVLYHSPERDDTGRPIVTLARRADRRAFGLRYADGIHFVIRDDGRHVRATWPEPWTVDDMATYLLGSVLAFVLRLRGVTCLHASAVAIDGRAVAILGPAGAGKSTIAASFAQRGFPVICDDVVALGGAGRAPVVQPGPPRVRLWPESVRVLYGSAEALPRLTPTWDKRFLDATADRCQFEDRPLPLGAIYVLGERASHPTLPRVTPLSPAAALIALVANTHTSHLVAGAMRAADFQRLGRLAASLRVRRLIPHEDPRRLPALCDVIVEDALGAMSHV